MSGLEKRGRRSGGRTARIEARRNDNGAAAPRPTGMGGVLFNPLQPPPT